MARRTAKSPEAFRTISEAADSLDLPQHVLRFWETRFNQIKPMKRSGGRRYYRPGDIALLQGIKHLLYDEGYTIKGVQRILREQGVAHVVTLGEQFSSPTGPAPVAPDVAVALAPVEFQTTTAPPVQVADVRTESVRDALSEQEQNHAIHANSTGATPGVSAPQQTHVTHTKAHPQSQEAPSTPPPGGPTLRFVPDPAVEAESSPVALEPQPLPSVSAPEPAFGARQPLPEPVAAPTATPPMPIGQNGLPQTNGTSHAPDVQPPSARHMPPLPHPTTPPGAVAPSLSLNARQTEALVSALRTLMDCKSQLDQARPIKQPTTTGD